MVKNTEAATTAKHLSSIPNTGKTSLLFAYLLTQWIVM